MFSLLLCFSLPFWLCPFLWWSCNNGSLFTFCSPQQENSLDIIKELWLKQESNGKSVKRRLPYMPNVSEPSSGEEGHAQPVSLAGLTSVLFVCCSHLLSIMFQYNCHCLSVSEWSDRSDQCNKVSITSNLSDNIKPRYHDMETWSMQCITGCTTPNTDSGLLKVTL